MQCLLFGKSLSFHCKHHKQHKADSTVNKNRNLLFKVGFISKENASMMSCLLVFIFSGNVNGVTGLYHA